MTRSTPSPATTAATRRARTLTLCAIATIAGLSMVSVAAATLDIMAPLCSLLPDVSKELAAFIGVCGIIFAVVAIWVGIKGPEVVVVLIKLALVVMALAGIMTFATKAFPSLSSYMCTAGA